MAYKKFLTEGLDPNSKYTADEWQKIYDEVSGIKPVTPYDAPGTPKEYYDYLADAYLKQAQTQSRAALQDYYSAANLVSQRKDDLSQYYDRLKRGAYTTARRGAVGSNEALANIGLAGNLYGAPTSGYSETSRIRQEVALQNQIAQYDMDEQQALNSLVDLMRSAQAKKVQAQAGIQTDYQSKMAGLAGQYQEYKFQTVQDYLDRINYMSDVNVDLVEKELMQAKAQGLFDDETYNYLRNEYLKKDAELLFNYNGVPIGYDEAKRLIDEINTVDDLSSKEKEVYNVYFNKTYGVGGKYAPLDPQVVKKYNIDAGRDKIIVSAAKEEDFGQYKDTGKEGSKQQKYVNAILKAAKQGKIPNGTMFDFNYGWGADKKGSIYVYYNGAFYLTNYTRAEGAKNGAYVAHDRDVISQPGIMAKNPREILGDYLE